MLATQILFLFFSEKIVLLLELRIYWLHVVFYFFFLFFFLFYYNCCVKKYFLSKYNCLFNVRLIMFRIEYGISRKFQIFHEICHILRFRFQFLLLQLTFLSFLFLVMNANNLQTKTFHEIYVFLSVNCLHNKIKQRENLSVFFLYISLCMVLLVLLRKKTIILYTFYFKINIIKISCIAAQ